MADKRPSELPTGTLATGDSVIGNQGGVTKLLAVLGVGDVKADGTVPFTSPQSGVTPMAAAHLATKQYVDAASSASGGNVKADGTVPFTAVQSGIDPTAAAHLATMNYVDTLAAANGGNVKADGSVAFTAVQPGVPATAPAHLTTKAQLDAVGADLTALLATVGVSAAATNLGTFTPDTNVVGANAIVKSALQSLEGTVAKLVALTGLARGVDAVGVPAPSSVLPASTDTLIQSLQKIRGQIAALESRDLEIGSVVQSGNFNVTLGIVTPFTTSAGNAIGLAPPTASLTDGAEFAVVLFGVPGSGFTGTVDLITRSQTVHGRAENIVIVDEVTPVRLRWSSVHSTWFIVS